ncbi:hypothetical protein D3C73_1451970 [compost metagenome]
MDIVHRCRQWARRAAAQIDKLLLHRGKQETSIGIAVGGHHVDAYHGVWPLALLGRLEVVAVQVKCLEQHLWCKVGSEGKRQAKLCRQLGAVQAGAQQPDRHV